MSKGEYMTVSHSVSLSEDDYQLYTEAKAADVEKGVAQQYSSVKIEGNVGNRHYYWYNGASSNIEKFLLSVKAQKKLNEFSEEVEIKRSR